jgi:flagellar motility protein MotE (MotC chaperone)
MKHKVLFFMKKGPSNGAARHALYFLVAAFCLLSVFSLPFLTSYAFAEDDMVRLVEKKARELKAKEEALKKEEERLNILKKEVDEKIEKYSKLLTQLEHTLKRIEKSQDDKLDQVVRAFESMPAEDAASGLAAMSEPMAVKILVRMKPKKAGIIMSNMEKNKVASLTEAMTRSEKNFPVR